MRLIILSSIAVAVAAWTSAAQAQTTPPAAAAASGDPALYVAKAGASDLYEIQSSQLALQKAAANEVRQFGQMMIQHHQMTTKQVIEAAHTAGMTPQPPTLEPPQQAMIQELQGLSGQAFDTAYLRQQRVAHDQALALHSDYATNGDNAALRRVAGQAVPIVQRHIDALRALPGGG
ncbi:DUF4142 domain-containing protein [Sphingomonas quercus]|uniref:DUF4142 domain-containing protein n=1 Tax=Sphingomonas quercus TaxID=2842451 RepID=A0ABS6BI28_9SPHN|nr:DUF4142 domain-containing protein [Sphingomonas quercus]MBU3077839.1 DUF4142 domain-containing protein [Sphingomonas quercus]